MTNEEFYHLACELLQNPELSQDDFFKAFNSVISQLNSDVMVIAGKKWNRTISS